MDHTHPQYTDRLNKAQQKNNEPTFKNCDSDFKYTIVPNHIICDKSISMSARLLLIFLISLPKEVMNDKGQMVPWVVYHSHLKKTMGIGNTALTTQLNELIAAGYMKRNSDERSRKSNGRYTAYEYLYSVFKVFLPNAVSESGQPKYGSANVISTKKKEITDIKKQQHEDPQKDESPPPKTHPPAAASSSKKAPSAKEKPAEKEKSEVLKNVNIPDSDKKWLENTFNSPTIEAAVTWATHPATKLKKTLAAGIKWFCSLEPKSRPSVPEQEQEQVHENRHLAKQIESQLSHPNGYEFVATNKLCYIDRGAYSKSIEIPYNTKKFKEVLYGALKDFHFKRKNE